MIADAHTVFQEHWKDDIPCAQPAFTSLMMTAELEAKQGFLNSCGRVVVKLHYI